MLRHQYRGQHLMFVTCLLSFGVSLILAIFISLHFLLLSCDHVICNTYSFSTLSKSFSFLQQMQSHLVKYILWLNGFNKKNLVHTRVFVFLNRRQCHHTSSSLSHSSMRLQQAQFRALLMSQQLR